MLKSFRRPVAIAAAVTLSFSTTGTPVLDASSVVTERTVAPRGGYTEAVLYDGSGRRVIHSKGHGIGAWAVSATRQFRSHKDTLEKIRDGFQRLSRKSKDRKARYAGVINVLSVVLAPTDAEFRAGLQTLPVSITRTPGVGDGGILGTWTNFYVKGQLRASMFRPATSNSGASTFESREPETANQPMGDAEESGAYAPTLATPIEAQDCEYEGVIGECATQQDFDDAVATVLVLEGENESISAEFEADFSEFESNCNDYEWGCGDTEDQFGETMMNLALEDGPNSFALADAFDDAGIKVTGSSAVVVRCEEQRNSVRGGVWTTFGSIAGGIALIIALPAAVPAALLSTVVVAVVGTVGGSMFWTASAFEGWLTCRGPRKPQ